MDVKPLHDRLVVRRLDEDEQKSGGIVVADTATEKPQPGKVIHARFGKVGAAGKRVPLDVKTSDPILSGTDTSQDVKLDGEPNLIEREDEILAVPDGKTKKTK
jgi:chaperonin GroES